MALQENYITDDDSQFSADSTYRAGQVFTALESYTLNQIKFKGYRHFTTATVTFALYATGGDGLPTGSALSTGTIATSAFSTSSAPGAWETVSMTSYSIVGGTAYALVAYTNGDYFYWRKDTTVLEFYGGMGIYSSNSGVAWGTPSVEDYMFEMHSGTSAGDTTIIGELYNDSRSSEISLRQTASLRSQSFTPQDTYALSKLKLRLKQTGSATGNVLVDIYAADGLSKPTGSILDSGSWDISTGTTATYGAMEDITGFSGYTLSASTEYCYVMRTDATGDNNVLALRSLDRYDYKDGKYTYSTDGGSTWIDTFNADFFFEEWHTVPSGDPVEGAPILDGVGGFNITTTVERQVNPTLPGTGGFSIKTKLESIYKLGILMTPLPMAVTPHPNKSADDDYNTKFSSIKAFNLFPNMLAGTKEDGEDTYTRDVGTGIKQPLFHYKNWFDRVHLLPRIAQDLGNIVSAQAIDVELYNSDMNNTITISSITNSLGNGVTVTGVPSVPFNLSPRENVEAVVTIETVGDLVIDGSYTFHQSTGETYTLFITGSRIVLLPIRPEAPLLEHLQWETKILTNVKAGEQRIANRDIPRGEFEFKFKEGIKTLEMILFDRQSKLLAVPAWHEPSFLTSAGAIDDLTVNVDQTQYGNFFTGGYAVVFQDEHTFDALKIDSMTSTSLTFNSGLSYDYRTNTQVMPLMTAWVDATTPMVKAVYNDQTINVKLRVQATDHSIADSSAFSTYNGKVFLDDPNFMPSKQMQEALRTRTYVIDNSTGDFSQFSLQERAIRNSVKGFKTNSRQELWELRQLLHFLKGRQVSFYIPTFTKDLVPSTTLINANSTFTMANIGYTNNVSERWPKQVFRMHLKDGTILTRTIQNSSEVSTAVEQLTVDIVWPYDIEPADIERVEFLTKVRFDADDIVIMHHNALGWAQCVVPTSEVTDDDV